MFSIPKHTAALNIDTLCRLRFTRQCKIQVGTTVKLSNKLLYTVVYIGDNEVFVKYAE